MTLREILSYVSDGVSLNETFRSPFDTFAFVGTVLQDSGWYRCVVEPEGDRWPPEQWESLDAWQAHVEEVADHWMRYFQRNRDAPRTLPLPQPVIRYRDSVTNGLDRLIQDPAPIEFRQDLATVIAICDECSWNVGMPGGALNEARTGRAESIGELGRRLRDRQSLSDFPPHRVRVLPKVRVPQMGIGFRSLTHNLSLIRAEADTTWETVPISAWRKDDRSSAILVLPWPKVIESSSFSPNEHHPLQIDERAFGFFEYESKSPFETDEAVATFRRATARSSQIDMIVLPELTLSHEELEHFENEIDRVAKVPPVIVGGIHGAQLENDWQQNEVVVSWYDIETESRQRVRQSKHHRWLLNGSQVQTYGLARELDDRRDWWESIAVKERRLHFLALNDDTVLCPLVCEDLARHIRRTGRRPYRRAAPMRIC